MESLNSKNLSSVTSDTTGVIVNTLEYASKVVWVNISGNSGTSTVDVKVQGSPDRETWFTLNESTFTTNGDRIYTYSYHIPALRTLTDNMSGAEVTTYITGGD